MKKLSKIVAVFLATMVIVSMTVITIGAAETPEGSAGGTTNIVGDLNINGTTALATLTYSGTAPSSCSISGTCYFRYSSSPQISVPFSGTTRASYTAPSNSSFVSAKATFTVKSGTATWTDSL